MRKVESFRIQKFANNLQTFLSAYHFDVYQKIVLPKGWGKVCEGKCHGKS